MTSPFSRYELRTKDPRAAREFYASIIEADLDITELPERARAAGAPSHWLGHIAGDVERALSAGAERIHGNVLRDPLGGVFAVSAGRADASTPIVCHQLNTTDVPRAKRFYDEAFAWNDDALAKITFTDLALQRGVHTAWLFHFRVTDLEATVTKLTAAGGFLAGIFELPDGDRLAVCDDPQGAFVAFRK